MKRETLTAKELAERVKVGDKLILEFEVDAIDLPSEKPIVLLGNWILGIGALTLIAPKPEVRMPQVGDVYEWVNDDSDKGAQWMQKEYCQQCIKSVGGSFTEGDKEPTVDWDFTATTLWKFLYNIHDRATETTQELKYPENITDDAYPDGKEWKTIKECNLVEDDEVEVLDTRLNKNEIVKLKTINVNEKEVLFDDNSACKLSNVNKIFRIYRRATPATWQPKEGETVWVRFFKRKVEVNRIILSMECAWVFSDSISTECFPVPLSELEPYTGQDAPKIDFSKEGQWLTNGKIFICTDGYEYKTDDGEYNFEAHQIGDSQKAYSSCQNWQPCTALQIQIINSLIETLRKP